MPDPVAWWGALTGTAASAVAVRQELRSRRIAVRVDHGWRYLLTPEDPPSMKDMLVYVMVTNIGGRRVAVQHVGWEWLGPAPISGAGEAEAMLHRAEVPLREPLLLEPDSVPLKETVAVGQLLHLVDPIDDVVWPVAFTGGGNVVWRGPGGPLVRQILDHWTESDLRKRFAALRDAAEPPAGPRHGLYSITPTWVEAEGVTGEIYAGP